MKLARSLPGSGHTTLVSDLAEEGAALALLEKAGDIDVLVANAGLPASGRLDGFSQDQIGRALRVNLESPVRMTRELLPRWEERGSGHFVFISSISGFASTPRASLYAATKFGLLLRTQSTRRLARQRDWRFGDHAWRHSRCRDVRRERRPAAARPRYGHPRAGWQCRSPRDRARQVGNLGGTAASTCTGSLRDVGARDLWSPGGLGGAMKVADSIAEGQTDKR